MGREPEFRMHVTPAGREREAKLREQLRAKISPLITIELAGSIKAMAEQGPELNNMVTLIKMAFPKMPFGYADIELAGQVLVQEAARVLKEDPTQEPWSRIKSAAT